MAFDGSGLLREFIKDQVFSGTLNITDTNDVLQVPLYEGTNIATANTAKDETATQAAYNGVGGSWVTTNECSGTNYTARGEELISQTVTNETNAVEFDAADTQWTNLTLDSPYASGCLIFDETTTTPTADRGISFHYFGGAQQVTAGTFTIVWDATNGIFRITI